MNKIKIEENFDRVVLLIDMDCFYCQVEEKLNPALKGMPVAVVQYNPWQGGGIIAVNYLARACGVTRHMRGDEAIKQCPEIKIISVPNIGEKADLTKYREAGEEVANVLQRYTMYLERASIDEAYLDITEAAQRLHLNLEAKYYRLEPIEYIDTYSVGHEFLKDYIAHLGNLYKKATDKNNDIPADLKREVFLIYGAAIANEIRAAVKSETGYDCSVGISHNKILAKLACGINKPKKQTILSFPKIPAYFENLPLKKIKGLGGGFGENVAETLKISFLGELTKFCESELKAKFGDKNGTFLYNICRGVDQDSVKPRLTANSIGTSKRFPGKNQINNLYKLIHWLYELSNEMCVRLEKDYSDNYRKGKLLTVSYKQAINGDEVLSTRSVPLKSYELSNIFKQSIDVIKNNTTNFINSGSSFTLNNSIKYLGISVGKFESIPSTSHHLQNMFTARSKSSISESTSKEMNELINKCEVNCGNLQQTNTEIQFDTLDKKRQKLIEKDKEEHKSIDLEERKDSDKKINTTDQLNNNIFSDSNDLKDFELLLESLESGSNEISKKNILSDNDKKTFIENSNCLEDKQDHEVNSGVATPENIINVESDISSTKRKHNETSDIITISNDDDNHVYESALHIKCKTCGELIDNTPSSILLHEDYHIAEKLNSEINAERKTLTSTKIEQITKRKKPNASETSNSKSDIRKFFGAMNESQNPLSSGQIDFNEISNGDFEMCPECKTLIKVSDLIEHNDFHMAKKLQREMYAIEKTSVEIRNSAINNRQTQKSTNVTSKTISSFFIKKI